MASSEASSPPTLQIAQILADLNSLQQAPPEASIALLHTLPNLPVTRHNSRPSIRLHSPPRFDGLGRRMTPKSDLTTLTDADFTSNTRPTFSTEISNVSSNAMSEESRRGSQIRMSSIGDGDTEPDTDLLRAKRLLVYYEKRDKLQEKGRLGLERSQQRVDEVFAKHKQKEREELDEREKAANARRLGVTGR